MANDKTPIEFDRKRVDMTSAVIQRSTNQIACDMGGEVVILDLKSGIYYGLDEVGALIWSLIEHPASALAIRDAIMADYDVDTPTCERDIRAFVDRMQAIGLVEIVNGSPV
ncbi:MAG: PqqD family peptide modification chaperone [Vicinamibacterales bacterium]